MTMEISKWYNNYQAPSVLMIDDLSDAYINIYHEVYKNDWGYSCDSENSAYSFLKKNLLDHFPKIKITFFVPYLRHNVIHDNTQAEFQKFAIGEREEFSKFLLHLISLGHEIAHHGSNHGKYINHEKVSTINNFMHEWELYESTEEGIEITKEGIRRFQKYFDITLQGGKFCGYKQRANSLEIIDQCAFLYWCDDVNYSHKDYHHKKAGERGLILFPTNFAGNAFVRLSYSTGDASKDRKKKVTQFIQPMYNVIQYKNLHELYEKGHVISIQEHISPSTSSRLTQSTNIVSDIESLNKIYTFLNKRSIWYANCQDIAKYIYVRDNSKVKISNGEMTIDFNNIKDLKNTTLSLCSPKKFKLISFDKITLAQMNNRLYVANVNVVHGKNLFLVEYVQEETCEA